ncbi:MAG: twin-arginine translocase TatA/TatE family subunit [Dehalococcoidia bacterium]|nr:twin-arginine translocase TatA/TatE family subunit [Dehalococcoidia bacterium]
MRLGLPELLIILFIVLLIFGAGRLPALASGLRKAVHAFRQGTSEGREEPTPQTRQTPRSENAHPKDSDES